jgi:signal transduction histidine kinase
MPRFTRHTLFWKYAGYFSGLVGALLVLSGGLSGYVAYRQSTTTLEDLQRAKAHFAASEIQNFIGRVEDGMVSTVTKFDATKGGGAGGGAEDLRLELIALLRHQPSITELRWIDAGGRERLALSRAASDDSDNGRNWLDDPLFQKARDNSKYFGPVKFRDGTEPYLSLAVSHSPAGPVLVAEVNLQFVVDVISKSNLGTGGLAYIIDSSGRLISHPDDSLVLSNTDLSALPQVHHALGRNALEEFPGKARNLEGLAVLATAVPIKQLGWIVFIEQPLEEALRPVYASIATSVGLGLVGLVAALAASLVLARHMVRPIRQIEAGAREIGEGRLDQRIDVRTGDELETLGVQFNRMAARLQEINETQESRIAERTRDLALANEAKTRFLAAASHDLRQPMHALALFVGQMSAIPVPAEGRALLERIERSIVALEALLEALLDLSKLDVGAVAPQPQAFAIHDLLSRLVTDFAPAAEAKGLALTLVPTSLWVWSDPLLLERILLNLVANAIRYSVEGRVLIGCRRRAESVDLVVADSGVGIAPIHLPNIFQEFYRAGPLREGLTNGLGLGLAIVRRLVLLLGHQITVESQLGKGTVFYLRIPRAVPQKRASAPQATLAQNLRGTRVLVVDDETSARDAIQGLLAQWGCDVITAEGGDEALRHVRNRRPDLVLCDLNLADGESGLHVVDRLREALGPDLACAFVTGESAPERIAEARASGDPIAFKPTKPAKLRALIEHLLYTR